MVFEGFTRIEDAELIKGEEAFEDRLHQKPEISAIIDQKDPLGCVMGF